MADLSGYRSQALDALIQMHSVLELLSKHGSLQGLDVTSMRTSIQKLQQCTNEQKMKVAVLGLTKSGKTAGKVGVCNFKHVVMVMAVHGAWWCTMQRYT